jgi:CheY-like chemotaxis protein
VIRIDTGAVRLTETDLPDDPQLRPGDYAALVVTDTGCGMDEATRERVFEPFFTTKEEGKGTGLGLSTVYGIVKQSGGSIRVESTVGESTTVRVLLPAAEAAPVLTAPTPPSRRGWETVLLAERDEAVRGVAREALRLSGYQVLEAARAEEAETLATEHSGAIHLVLAGGGAEGVDVVRLRAAHPETRVLPLRPGGTGDGVEVELLTRRVREALDAGGPR